MNLLVTDYNGAEDAIARAAPQEWSELARALTAMALHLKPSDQRGIQGRPIFDPVGTNQAITQALEPQGWRSQLPIPVEHRAIGTDVDYGKGRVLVEAQFSNYPFLLNNTFRLELVQRMGIRILEVPGLDVGVILTKGGMFPASNSTLYYEQAKAFLDRLSTHQMFRLPIRLVGLVVDPGPQVPCVASDYGGRYGRTVKRRETLTCTIERGRGLRCQITLNRRPPARRRA